MGDPYYDSLPFTLAADQLSYDFLLFGTNLQNCMLAAHLSKVKKLKGLVLEFEKGYGGDMRTLSLKELHEFMTNKKFSCQDNAPLLYEGVLPEDIMQRNVQEIERRKENPKALRGYNIDIQPRVFSGSSLACELMKEANMDQYMEFRTINKVLFVLNGKLEEVPLNLKTILNAKGLSLFERKDLFRGVHQLIKIYYKFHEIEADNNSTNQFDKDSDVNQDLYSLFCQQKDQLCHQFLMKVLNNRTRLFEMVLYGICGYQYRKPHPFVESQYTCLEMVKRFGRFVKSCGVYGQTPYLYVDNGIGDIPQSFSRIGSIYGSIFILHPKIEITEIEEKEGTYLVSTNLAPQQQVETKEIRMTESYWNYLSSKLHNQIQQHQELVLRVVTINRTPEGFPHKGPIIIHSFEDTSFVNPVTCFLFDSNSSSCPEAEYILQFMTIVESKEKQHIDHNIQAVLNLGEKLFGAQQPFYVSAYTSTNVYFKNYGKHIIRNDWNMDLEGVFEVFKESAGQQDTYFKEDETVIKGDEEDDYYSLLLNKLDNLKQKKEQKQTQQREVVLQKDEEPTDKRPEPPLQQQQGNETKPEDTPNSAIVPHREQPSTQPNGQVVAETQANGNQNPSNPDFVVTPQP